MSHPGLMGIRSIAKHGRRAAAPDPAATPGAGALSVSEAPVPPSSEEHPALRRIRLANEIADAMRSSGGSHRQEI
jgi:hypothetical protein